MVACDAIRGAVTMLENWMWLVTLVVVIAFVGRVQHNMRKSNNYRMHKSENDRAVTHPSLYIPSVFPPWALAMRGGEDAASETSPSLAIESDASTSRQPQPQPNRQQTG